MSSDKYKDFFETKEHHLDLKGKSVRGGFYTLTGQLSSYVLQVSSTVILARLLTPEDYGLIAMVIVIIGFAEMFNSLGLPMVTVQRPNLTHQQVSTLFWINIGLSLVIGAILVICSPLVALFFDEPRIVGVLIALTGSFVLGGGAIQHQALLRRQMKFGLIAIIQVSSMLSGVIAGILAALKGLSYWSLVYMQVAVAICNLATTWLFCRWIPSLPRRGHGVRSMLAFGGNVTGYNIFNYFSTKFDTFLIGKFSGATALGFYSKAFELLLMPIRQMDAPVTAVAVPVLSKLVDEPERYKNAYFKVINQIVLLAVPGIAFMIVTSDLLFNLLLGPQWGRSSQVFQILGFAGFPLVTLNSVGWLFISQGRTREMFHWGVIDSVARMLSIVIGIFWGIIGVAIAVVIRSYLMIFPCIWFVCRKGPVRVRDYTNTLLLAVILGCVVIFSVKISRSYFFIENIAVELLVNFSVAAASVLITAVFLPTLRSVLFEMMASIKHFLPDRSK